MRKIQIILAFALAAGMGACSQQGADDTEAAKADQPTEEQAVSESGAGGEPFEIVPGLVARILKEGSGDAAEAGDVVNVHYTGWLQDTDAEDGRGAKFDSSVDRGQQFSFPLGAGRVIKGWDQGVAGMLIGEKRELTIAPELAYGERGFPGAIPPSSTLIFEVELFGAAPIGDAPAE
jgi:FKBP-type peptidyl-prolyl cis-trans isomerase FkpA